MSGSLSKKTLKPGGTATLQYTFIPGYLFAMYNVNRNPHISSPQPAFYAVIFVERQRYESRFAMLSPTHVLSRPSDAFISPCPDSQNEYHYDCSSAP